MKKVRNGYQDGFATLPNLKVISYDTLQDLSEEPKFFVNSSSNYFKFDDDLLDDSGLSIYRLVSNPNIAYKLERGINFYEYNYSATSPTLISKLQDKQQNVSLTDFPTGIITIRGVENKDKEFVVGEEIVFYPEHIELYDAIEKYKNDKEFLYIIFDIYRQILDIFQELQDNDINYTDIHQGNILVRLNDLNVKLIDFETGFVNIGSYSKDMICKCRNLIMNINSMLGILNPHSLINASSIDEIRLGLKR